MATMGFSEEALRKFHAMCAAGLDFAEGESYDFARCVMADGEVYGTKGQCKAGKPIGEKGESSDTRMSKVKKAFMKGQGRNMNPTELEKARKKIAQIGVPIPAGQSAEDALQKLLPKGEKVMPVKSA